MRRRRQQLPWPFWTRLKNRAVLTLLIGLISGLAWLLDGNRVSVASSSSAAADLSPALPLETLSFSESWDVESIFAEPLPADLLASTRSQGQVAVNWRGSNLPGGSRRTSPRIGGKLKFPALAPLQIQTVSHEEVAK